MTRYYFDLHERNSVLADNDGVEADHLEAAKALALTAARDVMCGEISNGSLCLTSFIEIRDETQVVDRVTFLDAVSISGA